METSDALVADMLEVARHAASKYHPQERDDLQQEAAIGALQAAAVFDPAKNVKFKTFAQLRARGAVVDAIRRLFGRAGQKNLQAVAFDDLQREPAAQASRIELDDYEEVEAALRLLDQRERLIVKSYWGVCGHQKKTFGEIAADLGVTESRVCQVYALILERLQAQNLDAPSPAVVFGRLRHTLAQPGTDAAVVSPTTTTLTPPKRSSAPRERNKVVVDPQRVRERQRWRAEGLRRGLSGAELAGFVGGHMRHRQPRQPKKPRQRLEFDCTPELKAEIERAAKQCGMSACSWIRLVVRRALAS